MIKTKDDLRQYIAADRSRYPLRWFDRFIYSEVWHTVCYLRNLRKLEYALNNRHRPVNKLLWAIRYMRWRRQNWRFGIAICPNACGKGLYITHLLGGGIIIVKHARLGDNCTVGPNCIIGTKRSASDVPTIGNNVEICMGAKLYGTLTVGDNAIIAPNSVVIKDVPPNAIVSGVPASIVKIKNETPHTDYLSVK